MKTKSIRYLLIAFLSLLIIGLGSILIIGINDKNAGTYDEPTLIQEETREALDIDTLKVKGTFKTLNIFTNETQDTIDIKQFTLRKSQSVDKFRTTVKEKTLLVEIKQKSIFTFDFDFFTNKRKGEILTITLPKEKINHLKLDIDVGSVFIDGIEVDSATMRVSAGSIETSNFVAHDYDVKIDSGKISIDELNGTGKIKVSSGKLDIAKLYGDANIVLTSGKITINEFEGKLNSKTSSGKIDIDSAKFNEESTVSLTSGKFSANVSNLDKYCYITKITSGKIDVPNNYCGDANSTNVNLKVTSGKITINQ